jgi:predicted ATP-dependent endonuclease of OLD family
LIICKKQKKSNGRIDTGYFDVEQMKTIMVGANEAGKTVILQALQKLNAPEEIVPFDPFRDYPRSKYDDDIVSGKVDPKRFTVAEGLFELSPAEKAKLPVAWQKVQYKYGKTLANTAWHGLDGEIPTLEYKDIEKDIERLLIHLDENATKQATPAGATVNLPSAA